GAQDLPRLLCMRGIGQRKAQGQEDAIDTGRHHAGIRNRQEGWRIDQYKIILLAQGIKEFLQARRSKQFGRVVGEWTARENRQLWKQAGLDNARWVGSAREDRGQPGRTG